jgi:hypothetical protein
MKVEGFHGLVVRTRDVDALAPRIVEPERHRTPTLRRWRAPPASGDGCLRDEGHFLAPVEAGHIPAVQVANPDAGRLQHFLRPVDIAAFHRRFVTLTTLASKTSRHLNTLRGKLAAAGIARFAPGG